jgi:hypothetical protein
MKIRDIRSEKRQIVMETQQTDLMMLLTTVFSEDIGPCVPMWKNPSRMCRCNWGLLKVRKGNTKRAWWAQVESAGRESMLSFFRCF